MQQKNTLNKIFQLTIFAVVPIVGVLFFNWDWREVVLLYWLENVTIGIVTLIKIMRAAPVTQNAEGVIVPQVEGPKSLAGNIFLAGFFSIHYGMFTLVHGIFVLFFVFTFGGPNEGGVNLLAILPLWGLAAVANILGAVLGPKPEESADRSFANPYKRIVPLHITIIFGVIIIDALNLPSAAALMLIAVHVLIDLLWDKLGKGKPVLRIHNDTMIE